MHLLPSFRTSGCWEQTRLPQFGGQVRMVIDPGGVAGLSQTGATSAAVSASASRRLHVVVGMPQPLKSATRREE